MINVHVNIKNQLIGVLVKKVTCRILVRVNVSLIKHAKFVSILRTSAMVEFYTSIGW